MEKIPFTPQGLETIKQELAHLKGSERRDVIRAIAEAHGVPLHEDERLATLLCEIPLGDEIPETLYVAVAEVLAFVYRLEMALSERA